jgi:hypothetical protein
MTQDLWLEAHSYLRPLADLSAQVDRAAAGIEVLDARIPDWGRLPRGLSRRCAAAVER